MQICWLLIATCVNLAAAADLKEPGILYKHILSLQLLSYFDI